MKKSKKKKIFVTGALGFIGYHWCEKLLKEGHIVYGIDIKKKSNVLDKYKNFHFYKKTVFDYKILEKFVRKTDLTCHFAGIASPSEYLYNTAKVIDLTVKPSLKIIDFCKKYNKKMFFTSTSEIYGKSNKIPFVESDDRLLGATDKKRWCYSTSKALVEHSMFAKLERRRNSFIIFRLFNVYGPRLQGRVVDSFIEKAFKNKDLQIYGTGYQTRSFLYIDDCINIFYKIFLKKNLKNEIINIGNNKETSVRKLANIIIKLTNSKSKIKFIKMNKNNKMKKSGYEDISRRVPSIKKQSRITKYYPSVSLEDGLRDYIINYGN